MQPWSCAVIFAADKVALWWNGGAIQAHCSVLGCNHIHLLMLMNARQSTASKHTSTNTQIHRHKHTHTDRNTNTQAQTLQPHSSSNADERTPELLNTQAHTQIHPHKHTHTQKHTNAQAQRLQPYPSPMLMNARQSAASKHTSRSKNIIYNIIFLTNTEEDRAVFKKFEIIPDGVFKFPNYINIVNKRRPC